MQKIKKVTKTAKTAKPEEKAVADAKKYLSPADLLQICKSSVVDVPIPAWDAYVKCKIPSADEIYNLRVSAPSNEDFQKALFRACLIDFTPAQLDELSESNGLKYFELYNAVINNTDLFTIGITKGFAKN